MLSELFQTGLADDGKVEWDVGDGMMVSQSFSTPDGLETCKSVTFHSPPGSSEDEVLCLDVCRWMKKGSLAL